MTAHGTPVNPENYQPIPEPRLAGQISPTEMGRLLRAGRIHGIGRTFFPRWAGDGQTPTIVTRKPGAFRTRDGA